MSYTGSPIPRSLRLPRTPRVLRSPSIPLSPQYQRHATSTRTQISEKPESARIVSEHSARPSSGRPRCRCWSRLLLLLLLILVVWVSFTVSWLLFTASGLQAAQWEQSRFPAEGSLTLHEHFRETHVECRHTCICCSRIGHFSFQIRKLSTSGSKLVDYVTEVLRSNEHHNNNQFCWNVIVSAEPTEEEAVGELNRELSRFDAGKTLLLLVPSFGLARQPIFDARNSCVVVASTRFPTNFRRMWDIGMPANFVNSTFPLQDSQFNAKLSDYVPTDAASLDEVVTSGESHSRVDFRVFRWCGTSGEEILHSLQHAEIPVILGECRLPFSQCIDWSTAVVNLPASANDLDIQTAISRSKRIMLSMRESGRRIWINNLENTRKIISTLICSLISQTPHASSAPFRPFPSPILKSVRAQWSDISPPFIAETNTLSQCDMLSSNLIPSMTPPLSGTPQFTAVVPTCRPSKFVLRSLDMLAAVNRYVNKLVLVVCKRMANTVATIDWERHAKTFPIEIINPPVDSMNNRFRPFDVIKTEAILVMDDDVFADKESILNGFRVWTENPARVVGYGKKSHFYNATSRTWHYTQHSSSWSIVIGQLFFVHRTYLYTYDNFLPSEIRSWIDENSNCDDIAMNCLVAHHSKLPPIILHELVRHLSDSGTSTEPHHYARRSQCLHLFTRIFGHQQLWKSGVSLKVINSIYRLREFKPKAEH